MAEKRTVEAEYANVLKNIQEEASQSVDPRLVATFIALKDSRVRSHLIEKVSEGYPFLGISWPQAPDFELVSILFKFACKPGTFCIKPPSILVTVNLITRSVVSIQDPTEEHFETVALELADFPKPKLSIAIEDATVSDGKACATVVAVVGIGNKSKTFKERFCVDVNNCVDVISTSIFGVGVKIELCANLVDGKVRICFKGTVKFGPFSKSAEACANIG